MVDRPVPGTDDAGSPGPAPDVARALFGARLGRAEQYAASLATDGVERGLIGPREVSRLWSRHLVNSALIGCLGDEVLPHGASVCDVGSGAGLPGIPLALARPDLRITLLEPLERRAAYLQEIVALLELPSAEVVRGRAEERSADAETFDVVTARALAPLDRLLAWTVPLLAPDGRVVAVKGRTAQDEVDSLPRRTRAGLRSVDVLQVQREGFEDEVTVVVVRSGAPRRKPSTDRRRRDHRT